MTSHAPLEMGRAVAGEQAPLQPLGPFEWARLRWREQPLSLPLKNLGLSAADRLVETFSEKYALFKLEVF